MEERDRQERKERKMSWGKHFNTAASERPLPTSTALVFTDAAIRALEALHITGRAKKRVLSDGNSEWMWDYEDQDCTLCDVCYEDMGGTEGGPNNAAQVAVCEESGHAFCRGCWDQWISAKVSEGQRSTCPTCRTPFGPEVEPVSDESGDEDDEEEDEEGMVSRGQYEAALQQWAADQVAENLLQQSVVDAMTQRVRTEMPWRGGITGEEFADKLYMIYDEVVGSRMDEFPADTELFKNAETEWFVRMLLKDMDEVIPPATAAELREQFYYAMWREYDSNAPNEPKNKIDMSWLVKEQRRLLYLVRKKGVGPITRSMKRQRVPRFSMLGVRS